MIGLDTSPRRIGWAVAGCEDTWQPIAAGSMPGVRALTSAERRRGWKQGDVWRLYGPQMILEAFDEIARQVEQHGTPAWAWQENPRHGRNLQHAFTTHQALGMIALRVWQRWKVQLEPIEPSSWRPSVGISGNAKRAEVKAAAITLAGELGFDCGKDEDAAEAACIVRHGWLEIEGASRPWERAT